ncbi:hypothetical protein EI983_18715 [Roseovarius faecimaris]|uniref:Uncharacterized protein n=1 Tax=Roseovarius faecimaris TaxID=2494550 RepID=A0A6I6IVT4_9RHOB|nr:hypothetical protein [Roseovarius faecimaris]QGY00185.1 hypothetical protein EI983_18715 [Roseovarius faecimaris]
MAWAYSNGRDHEKAARRRAEQAQRDKAARELDRKIRENELAIARTEERIAAIHQRALVDDKLREAIRLALWAKVPGAVTGSYVKGEAVLIPPEGLPNGLTEEDLNAAILAGLCGNKTDP